jgi:hypothetical protein
MRPAGKSKLPESAQQLSPSSMTSCTDLHTYSFVLRVRHAESLQRISRGRTAGTAMTHAKVFPLRNRIVATVCCKAKAGT